MSSQVSKNYKVLHLGDQAFVGYNLVKLLQKNGIKADYLAYKNSQMHYNEDGCFFFKANSSERFNKIKIIRESLSHFEGYDIIHAHSVFSVPLLLSKNRPYALHLHGSDIRVYARKNDLLGFGLRKLVNKAKKIFVSTPDLLMDVSSFGKNATFLPNPVDFERFYPKKPEIDLQEGFDFIIFHPTRHSLNKGNQIFIKSFSEIISQGYNAKLVMVEWGDLLHESKNLVHKLNISKNVEWIKSIPPYEMADYYNASDLVFDQFHLKGLGLVSFEAMACGKLTITKYSPEYLKQGYSINPPLSIIDEEVKLTQEVISFLDDARHRKKMGSACLNWVKEEHSSSKILSILKQSYDEIQG
ncbi:glycosyltransferase family 4 protein [Methanosarcina mazei]|nr:glycosyltransferase family 4 protein [Methanosarcina mazei]WIM47864.1 glycosyltransferase family 4 protein [Methanosarcina mazei]